MKLQELLIRQYDKQGLWGIVRHLISLYPDQLKNADAYLAVIAELLALEPVDAEGFSLHVEMVEEPGPFDDEDFEPWAHVFGRNGKTNRDNDKEGWHLPEDPTPEQLEQYDTEANWAMEFTPWDELLAMEVVTDLVNLNDVFVVILWEITFVGFSNEEVAEKNEQLMGRVDDAKDPKNWVDLEELDEILGEDTIE